MTMQTAPRRIEAIVIGGSAGALDALSVLLPALPRDCAVPVALVVHLPPARPSRLAAVLAARAVIPVEEVEDKQPVAPGRVYVAPPEYHLLVERTRTFALSADELVYFSRPAIDVLFESAAEVYGAALAGIVLTGASEDGARGLAAIADGGGVAVVQAPEGAAARHMPDAAIARVGGAHVLPLAEIADLMAAWARPGGAALEEAAR
jgi:two-component system chemotaxis response regulator CheB